MRIIARMDLPSPSSGSSKASEEKIETVRSDKSQATMANFIVKGEKKEN
jgi:hypothetical protein